MPLGAIAERSPRGDPDVTRLLDRLERRGLATRTRESADRRVVIARMTNDGRQLLGKLQAGVTALHERQLAMLSQKTRQELRRLLQRIAEPVSK
jgi:DNA-binding MarR family transcriptional regulator